MGGNRICERVGRLYGLFWIDERPDRAEPTAKGSEQRLERTAGEGGAAGAGESAAESLPCHEGGIPFPFL